MAIDTEGKRRSALSRPWAPVLPLPDGAVGSGDRPHVAHSYAGLVYAAVVAAGRALGALIRRRRR